MELLSVQKIFSIGNYLDIIWCKDFINAYGNIMFQVNIVSFTGSTAVGQHIARAAAPMMKKLSLELGNPLICLSLLFTNRFFSLIFNSSLLLINFILPPLFLSFLTFLSFWFYFSRISSFALAFANGTNCFSMQALEKYCPIFIVYSLYIYG